MNPSYPQQHGDKQGYDPGYGVVQNPMYPPPTGYPQPGSAAYPPAPSGYQAPGPYQPPHGQAAYPPPPSYENAMTNPVDSGPTIVNCTPADEYGGVISFSDKSIRMGFIRKVYFILMCQLGFTVGTICLFLFCKPVQEFVQGPHALAIYLSAYGIFIVLYLTLVCCDSVRRSYPSNLICLCIFTVALSYLVATISSFHSTNVVLIMMGVTTLVCMSVMIFACQTKYDFTTWRGVLFCAALALFFMSVFTPVWLLLKTTAGMIILGGALALLFVAFLAYDTQLIMGGKKYELSPEEHIFGALTLYMDIIRIFLLLLAIFGRGNN